MLNDSSPVPARRLKKKTEKKGHSFKKAETPDRGESLHTEQEAPKKRKGTGRHFGTVAGSVSGGGVSREKDRGGIQSNHKSAKSRTPDCFRTNKKKKKEAGNTSMGNESNGTPSQKTAGEEMNPHPHFCKTFIQAGNTAHQKRKGR